MSFSPRGGGKGGKGGGRGGFGKGKGKGGKGDFNDGPPDRVEVVGTYMHECEGEMVCKLSGEVLIQISPSLVTLINTLNFRWSRTSMQQFTLIKIVRLAKLTR